MTTQNAKLLERGSCIVYGKILRFAQDEGRIPSRLGKNPKSQAPNPKQKKGKFHSSHPSTNAQNV